MSGPGSHRSKRRLRQQPLGEIRRPTLFVCGGSGANLLDVRQRRHRVSLCQVRRPRIALRGSPVVVWWVVPRRRPGTVRSHNRRLPETGGTPRQTPGERCSCSWPPRCSAAPRGCRGDSAASVRQALDFRGDATVFRLNATTVRQSGSEPAFRRNTAKHVYTIEAAHNPEVAGSKCRPATSKAPDGAFAFPRQV